MANKNEWDSGMEKARRGREMRDKGWWLLAEGAAEAIPRGISGAIELIKRAAEDLSMEAGTLERHRSMWFYWEGPVVEKDGSDLFALSVYREVMARFPDDPAGAKKFLRALARRKASWTLVAVRRELNDLGTPTESNDETEPDTAGGYDPVAEIRKNITKLESVARALRDDRLGLGPQVDANIQAKVKMLEALLTAEVQKRVGPW